MLRLSMGSSTPGWSENMGHTLFRYVFYRSIFNHSLNHVQSLISGSVSQSFTHSHSQSITHSVNHSANTLTHSLTNPVSDSLPHSFISLHLKLQLASSPLHDASRDCESSPYFGMIKTFSKVVALPLYNVNLHIIRAE